jgi:hypothetical protein
MPHHTDATLSAKSNMAAAARERKRQREGDAVPSTAAPAMGTGEARYVYLSIADALKATGIRVCLFAAVSEIGAAFRSRGTGEPPHPLSLPFNTCRAPAALPPRVLAAASIALLGRIGG